MIELMTIAWLDGQSSTGAYCGEIPAHAVAGGRTRQARSMQQGQIGPRQRRN
jgi:hypothetical protein